MEIYTNDHVVDSARVVLVQTRKINVTDDVYASCRRTERASSVQLEKDWKHFFSVKKTLNGQSSVLLESIECSV